LKQIIEEINKTITELIKENEKKKIGNFGKKNKNNTKKSELFSEFLKNKGDTKWDKTASTYHDLDGQLQKYRSFVSKNDLKQLFDKINHILSFEDEIKKF